jgi:hypothetical protein
MAATGSRLGGGFGHAPRRFSRTVDGGAATMPGVPARGVERDLRLPQIPRRA